MDTIAVLQHFAEGYELLAYLALFVAIVIEGELAAIVGGIFAHVGAFSMPVVVAVVFAGAITKTVSWYWLGTYLGGHDWARKMLGYIENRVVLLLPRLRERPFWSIFFSKFIYGVNHITLILSGTMRINYKTYFKAEFYSSIIWTLGMTSLGFFFSRAAIGYSKELHKFSLAIGLFIISFILIEKCIIFLIKLRSVKK